MVTVPMIWKKIQWSSWATVGCVLEIVAGGAGNASICLGVVIVPETNFLADKGESSDKHHVAEVHYPKPLG